jgi:fluoroacetyl-CoA thioesterase
VSMAGEPLAHGHAMLEVTEADTAQSLGSGDLPVLGTPRVVALIEQAAVAAATGRMESTQTSVGIRIDVEHLAPSRIGTVVEAEAALVRVDGRTLYFDVRVTSEGEELARGSHVRFIVDRVRFLARAGVGHPADDA